MRRWAERRLVPKVLIANQTRVIEAVHDPDGAWLPGVPVLTCTTEEPERVLGVLGSPAATAWVRHHAAGSGMSARRRAPDPRPAGLDPARSPTLSGLSRRSAPVGGSGRGGGWSSGATRQRRPLTVARIVIQVSWAAHRPAMPSAGTTRVSSASGR